MGPHGLPFLNELPVNINTMNFVKKINGVLNEFAETHQYSENWKNPMKKTVKSSSTVKPSQLEAYSPSLGGDLDLKLN
jgi:hypothetical protein